MKDMTEQQVFLADTYALIEIVGGNPVYKPYAEKTLRTMRCNLAELYYHFLQDYSQEAADKYFDLYSGIIIPVSLSSIRFAMAFKLHHRRDKLSYTDCMGYALALELGIPFLTGDEKFREKPNVEFVK